MWVYVSPSCFPSILCPQPVAYILCFLNLPLISLYALSDYCRRARLTGILLYYLFLLPWPPLFSFSLLASCFLVCFHACFFLNLGTKFKINFGCDQNQFWLWSVINFGCDPYRETRAVSLILLVEASPGSPLWFFKAGIVSLQIGLQIGLRGPRSNTKYKVD